MPFVRHLLLNLQGPRPRSALSRTGKSAPKTENAGPGHIARSSDTRARRAMVYGGIRLCCLPVFQVWPRGSGVKHRKNARDKKAPFHRYWILYHVSPRPSSYFFVFPRTFLHKSHNGDGSARASLRRSRGKKKRPVPGRFSDQSLSEGWVSISTFSTETATAVTSSLSGSRGPV